MPQCNSDTKFIGLASPKSSICLDLRPVYEIKLIPETAQAVKNLMLEGHGLQKMTNAPLLKHLLLYLSNVAIK